jgi:hypothetical protein
MPTRTSRADSNYFSIAKNQATWFAGTPEAKDVETWQNPLVLTPLDSSSWDAILKVTNSVHVVIENAIIAQGRENVVDCNNGAHHNFIHGQFGAIGQRGDQVVTVKGGCHDLSFSGQIHSEGKKADIVVGAWSDQSHVTSHMLDFGRVSRADGRPVTLILGRVNNPISALFGRSPDIILPDGAKVLFWRSLGEQLYWWGKLAAVKLNLIPAAK